MLRRILGPALAGTLALVFAACENAKFNGSANNRQTTAEGNAPAPADIGDPLYADVPVPRLPAQAAAPSTDPIVLRNCQVSLPGTQNVPSKNDGRLLEFCTPVSDQEAKGLKPDQIYEHPSAYDPTKKVKYRKLKEGDVVKPDQLIAVLDNALARANYLIEKAAVESSIAKRDANKEVLNASIAEYDMYVLLKKTN